MTLHRRVTGYYLVFSLLAVVWLVVGLPALIQVVITAQSDNSRLQQLGRNGAAMVTAIVRGSETDTQLLVDRMQIEGSLAYCSVEGIDGKYIAHSRREKVGQMAPAGPPLHSGAHDTVKTGDFDGQPVREYCTALHMGDKLLGTLCLAVPEWSLESAISAGAEYAPWALIGPVLGIALGAVVLRSALLPLTEIETQLRSVAAAPTDYTLAVTRVRPFGSVGIGWNRIAESFGRREPAAGLQGRLNQALEGYRDRKSEQALNSLPDGVALTDHDGVVTFANPAMVALVANGATAVVGEKMTHFLSLGTALSPEHPLLHDDQQLRDVVAEIGKGGDMSKGVLRVARFPLRSADKNSPNCHLWSVRDITQQKMADQMRNQFVFSATHELRTPLANIKAYAETLSLADVIDVEQQKNFCNIINSEATRLGRFIDDLLSLSRMQAGSLALDRQPTDMIRLLHETVANVQPQLTQKKVAFDVLLAEKLPELRVDKDKVAVTLVNLLGNAAKYTPEGGRVTLKAEVANQQFQIHVEDTGIGISVEDLPKVFDKFFRSADPRVREETGTGLGLSLAYEVARLHGGKLTVHSELNKGSKFTFTLPL